MMKELLNERLQLWTSKQGDADRVVSFGVGETDFIESEVEFQFGSYKFRIEATVAKKFSFAKENLSIAGGKLPEDVILGAGNNESMLKKVISIKGEKPLIQPIWDAMSGWRVFHVNNTCDRAPIKRGGNPYDDEYLRSDGENLAAFLFMLSKHTPDIFGQICDTVRLAIPFFEDFVLKPEELKNGES